MTNAGRRPDLMQKDQARVKLSATYQDTKGSPPIIPLSEAARRPAWARMRSCTKASLAIAGGLSTNGYRSCSPMLRLIELTAKVSGSHASIRRFKSPSCGSKSSLATMPRDGFGLTTRPKAFAVSNVSTM